jgi:pyruvate dehydrogenase E2 component (dihydrolipoamide acetyltransferase)
MPVQPITMPKWGLAMQEGTLAKWSVAEGSAIRAGQEIADIETTKIANVYESPVEGILRKRIAQEGESLPVGALLAVVADQTTPQEEIDNFVADFLANFKTEAASAEKPPEPQFVDVAGRRSRYLRLGSDGGPPIVLIHGFGADLSGWMFNHAALAEDRDVIAIDLAGHGAASKDVGLGRLEDLSSITRAMLDALDIQRAHLIGHSLGGAIATRIGLDQPERVSALTLIAPAGFGEQISASFIEGLVAETRARKLRPILERLVANPALITSDMVEDVLKFKRLDGAAEALRRIAGHLVVDGRQAILLRDRLGELAMPVQVIWGEADQVLPVGQAEGLPEGFEIQRFAAAGHIAHMEKAAEVNAAIRQFAARTIR